MNAETVPLRIRSAKEIEDRILALLRAEVQVATLEPQPNRPFVDYGVDSFAAAAISGELAQWLDLELTPGMLVDYATPALLAEHLAAADASRSIASTVKPEDYIFAQMPEFRALQMRLNSMHALGIDDPFRRSIGGATGAVVNVNGRPCINFATYDYLGMTTEPTVRAAAHAAIDCYGTSASASRVASGERAIHREFEEKLAAFMGVEETLAFVSGHATNVTTIGHLMGPKDLILYDAHAHNSITLGAQMSGAKCMPFRHNDVNMLERLLETHRVNYRRVLICIEGVYSAHGDIPNLPAIVTLKKRHKALLMVDEAHSFGVLGKTGRGICEHHEVSPRDVDIHMGTLSKALASCGGYIGGSRALLEHLRYSCGGFVFSAGIPPSVVASSLAALEVLVEQPERPTRLRHNASYFKELAEAEGLDTGTSMGAGIVPWVVGDSLRAMQLSETLLNEGINALPMVYPAVEEGGALIRFFFSAPHTDEQIRKVVKTLAQLAAVA